MRGTDIQNETLFAYVTPESFVPKDHPLRAIRSMADQALSDMSQLFDSNVCRFRSIFHCSRENAESTTPVRHARTLAEQSVEPGAAS